MPLLTRLTVRTSLLYLVAALLPGVLLGLATPLPLPAAVRSLAPVYLHLFTVGWVTQLIVGIAYWMFPKGSAIRPRGYDALAWTSYFCLNAGLLLRAAAEPLHAATGRAGWGLVLVLAAALQWLAALAFVVNTWPRVRGR